MHHVLKEMPALDPVTKVMELVNHGFSATIPRISLHVHLVV